MNRHVDIFAVAQVPAQYLVWSDGKERAGYALITGTIKTKPSKIQLLNGTQREQIKEAALWHIYVDEKFRGQGYGKTLLEAIKATYDTIYTQALTKEGKKLLMANGFIREEGDGVPMFRWRKDKQ